MAIKTCTKCKKTKPLSDFYTDSRHVDGLRSQCKLCQLTSNKKWIDNNPVRVSEIRKKFDDTNPNYKSDWARNHPTSVSNSQRKWRKNNPNYDSHKWMREHPEQPKNWKINNPEQWKLIHNRASAKRRRDLKWVLLFDNPFPSSIPIDYHHISDGFVVAIPKSLHTKHLHGSNTKLHRQELKPIIEQIYNISYIID